MAFDPKTDLVVMHRHAARELERISAKVRRLKRELDDAQTAKRLAKKSLAGLEAALRASTGLAADEWICERCGVTRLSKASPICRQCVEDAAEARQVPKPS